MPKEKLTDKQFLLILNGPTCGGKTSVSNVLFEKYGNIYKGKADAIKWLISDYDSELHRMVVHEMSLETMRVALLHGLSVVVEGVLWEPRKYIELAKNAKIHFFIANIEAPSDVLASRFETRIENKKRGEKVANTDPKRFKELCDMYSNIKMRPEMKTEMEFDSSVQSPQKIAEAIVSCIRAH